MVFIWNRKPLLGQSVGISLGWNCETTSQGIIRGLRGLKKDGYKTCPFDVMVSNYEGVIQCLYDDFKDFTNPEYLKSIPVLDIKHLRSFPGEIVDNTVIYKTKYKFCHIQESPGYALNFRCEIWEGGNTHFVDNNYEKLIERLTLRVQNFRNYINSGNHINFLITDFDKNLTELHTCIKTMYPNLKYTIIRFDLQTDNLDDETPSGFFNRHHKYYGSTRLAPYFD
jgi:hypothetical protein